MGLREHVSELLADLKAIWRMREPRGPTLREELRDVWQNAPGRPESSDEYDSRRREADRAKWKAIKETKQ